VLRLYGEIFTAKSVIFFRVFESDRSSASIFSSPPHISNYLGDNKIMEEETCVCYSMLDGAQSMRGGAPS
jgi:hypothetical protein